MSAGAVFFCPKNRIVFDFVQAKVALFPGTEHRYLMKRKKKNDCGICRGKENTEYDHDSHEDGRTARSDE